MVQGGNGDGWTSMTQNHYLTVPVRYIIEGGLRQKGPNTKAVNKQDKWWMISDTTRI